MIENYDKVVEEWGCAQTAMMNINPDEDLRRWCVQKTVTILANADYYYTKKEVDEIIKSIVISGGTTPQEVQEMIDEAISGKVDTSTYENYTGATAIELGNKLDASAYTPTDLSEYWTSAQTSSAIDGATSGKADTTAVTQSISAATEYIEYQDLGGLKFVSLTQEEYDDLDEKDTNTIYFIQ